MKYNVERETWSHVAGNIKVVVFQKGKVDPVTETFEWGHKNMRMIIDFDQPVWAQQVIDVKYPNNFTYGVAQAYNIMEEESRWVLSDPSDKV